MTRDARRTQPVTASDERSFVFAPEVRTELNALFAPMDRSVAASVVSAIEARGRRRRSLQALWLGMSPVVAVALVAVLYIGGMGLFTASPSAGPQGMVTASGSVAATNDLAEKGFTAPAVLGASAVRSSRPALVVHLQGDAARKGVLAAWLRIGHPDAAAELESAAPGATIPLVLDSGEARGFVTLMVLHGFRGYGPSGLLLSAQSSSEAWMSALQAVSSTITLLP